MNYIDRIENTFRVVGMSFPERLGLNSIACGLVLGDFSRPSTNGVSLECDVTKQTADHDVPYIKHNKEHEV